MTGYKDPIKSCQDVDLVKTLRGREGREAILDPAGERDICSIALWEIATKVATGKLALPVSEVFFRQQLSALDATFLPVDFAHCAAYLALPLHHRDPFDRMLIAQARHEGSTIVTRVRAFAPYGVPTIWQSTSHPSENTALQNGTIHPYLMPVRCTRAPFSAIP